MVIVKPLVEWSPIRSVIIQVIMKSDDHEAGVRFVNHEYDYEPTNNLSKFVILRNSARLD